MLRLQQPELLLVQSVLDQEDLRHPDEGWLNLSLHPYSFTPPFPQPATERATSRTINPHQKPLSQFQSNGVPLTIHCLSRRAKRTKTTGSRRTDHTSRVEAFIPSVNGPGVYPCQIQRDEVDSRDHRSHREITVRTVNDEAQRFAILQDRLASCLGQPKVSISFLFPRRPSLFLLPADLQLFRRIDGDRRSSKASRTIDLW